MHCTTDTYTERIFSQLDLYREEFFAHPFFQSARSSEPLPLSTLRTFASYQFADSLLWIPMLALLRSKVTRSEVLQRSIEKNIACEAGLGSVSHVALCARMMRSLGANAESTWTHRADMYEWATKEWLSDEFASLTEPGVAGWLLVAESLVPVMFERMLPCFAGLPGCDTTYFLEHIDVDESEHSEWMAQSVRDVMQLYGPEHALPQVLQGMSASWEQVLEVPSMLCKA